MDDQIGEDSEKRKQRAIMAIKSRRKIDKLPPVPKFSGGVKRMKLDKTEVESVKEKVSGGKSIIDYEYKENYPFHGFSSQQWLK